MKMLKYTIVCTLVVAFGIFTQTAYGFDPQAVAQFKKSIVLEMCKGGGNWLRCYRLEPFNCQDTVRGVVGSCVDSVLSNIKSLDRMRFVQWMSEDVKDCIKSSFEREHGARKLGTPECAS